MHKRESKEVDQILEKLQKKETRVEAFYELIEMGRSNTIQPLIESIKKMTWEEALSVSDSLGQYGEKIIPYLENILKPSEKPSVYTAAIKALGNTKNERAFNVVYTLLERKERWILSNELTFGEAINAVTLCGGKHLKEFVHFLDSSDWQMRNGGVYVCGKIGSVEKRDKKYHAKLMGKLHSLAIRDRSEKVKNMAKLAIDNINGKGDIGNSYKEAMFLVQEKINREDLYSKYADKIESVIKILGLYDYPTEKMKEGLRIRKEGEKDVFLRFTKSDKTGEDYFIIYINFCELPRKDILPLYRRLLEWNEVGYTGSAKFFVSGDQVFLKDVIRVDSLDPNEVPSSVEVLVHLAKEYLQSANENFY